MTTTQRLVLENLIQGLPPDDHIHGRAAYGGYSATVSVLLRRGWVTVTVHHSLEITEAGRKALGGT